MPMPKSVIIFSIISTMALSALGQMTMAPSVVAAGGNYRQGESFSISWTIGDIAVSTLTGETLILTQGFHQPTINGTGVDRKKFLGNIFVYPNPVKDELFIRFEILNRSDYLLEIQDITGRILLQKQYKQVAPEDLIRITSLPHSPGIYFLKLTATHREEPFVTPFCKTE